MPRSPHKMVHLEEANHNTQVCGSPAPHGHAEQGLHLEAAGRSPKNVITRKQRRRLMHRARC